jgi:alpha-D-xyloside xylohydrolase
MVIFMARVYKFDLKKNLDIIASEIYNQKENLSINNVTISEDENFCTVVLSHSCGAVYGLGERFDRVNQKNSTVKAEVTEQFCNQGSISYCPIPFFFTDNKLGVFIDTFTVTEYKFGDTISIKITKDSKGQLPVVYFFHGEPKEILTAFSEVSGKPTMIPKWSFGPWMSANRWSTEKEIKTQLDCMKKYKMPHSVMVIEAWSDEATFYRFNEHGEWEDPEGLVKLLSDNDVHVILWQIPVLKRLEKDERHAVLEQDRDYAIKH